MFMNYRLERIYKEVVMGYHNIFFANEIGSVQPIKIQSN
jgi:hypothetical protein